MEVLNQVRKALEALDIPYMEEESVDGKTKRLTVSIGKSNLTITAGSRYVEGVSTCNTRFALSADNPQLVKAIEDVIAEVIGWMVDEELGNTPYTPAIRSDCGKGEIMLWDYSKEEPVNLGWVKFGVSLKKRKARIVAERIGVEFEVPLTRIHIIHAIHKVFAATPRD